MIGAGAGGLAAAVAAAGAGLKVTVLEAGRDPGGKLGRVLLPGGVEADTGPTVLTLPDVLETLFERAGTSLAAELPLRELDLSTRYHWPTGERLDTYKDLDKTLAAARAQLSDEAAREMDVFLSWTREVWEEAAPSFVYGSAPRATELLGLALKRPRSLFKLESLRTLKQAIDARVRDPRVRDVFTRFSTYNGSNALACPATLACIAWVELGLGAWGIEGGMHNLPRALQRVAEQRGATFRFGTRVARIVVEKGRARGVVLETGEELRADAVIANADARHVARRLLDRPLQRLSRGTRSMSAWNGIVKARRRSDRPPHEVLFPRVYDEEMRDIFERGRAPAEPTVYVCSQEKSHGRAGWDDHEVVFLMANAPARDDELAPGVPGLGEVALQRVREAGLIDVDDEVVWQRTPRDLELRFPDTAGAIYGAASDSALAAFMRPPNQLPELPGLYLASGSAHPGGGVPLCLLSGLRATDAVLARTERRAA